MDEDSGAIAGLGADFASADNTTNTIATIIGGGAGTGFGRSGPLPATFIARSLFGGCPRRLCLASVGSVFCPFTLLDFGHEGNDNEYRLHCQVQYWQNCRRQHCRRLMVDVVQYLSVCKPLMAANGGLCYLSGPNPERSGTGGRHYSTISFSVSLILRSLDCMALRAL